MANILEQAFFVVKQICWWPGRGSNPHDLAIMRFNAFLLKQKRYVLVPRERFELSRDFGPTSF